MARTPSLRSALLAAALLAGCDVTFPWDRTPAVDASLESSATTLDFHAHVDGGAPPAQIIDLRVRPDWLRWWPQLWSPGFTISSELDLPDGTHRYSIGVSDPNLLGEGSHTGDLYVVACMNADASMYTSCDPVPGTPWRIPLTYVVGPRALSVSPTLIPFEQTSGGPAASPQAVTLSGADDAGGWSSAVEFYGEVPWFTVTPDAGSTVPVDVQLQVTAPAGAIPRSLSATLRFIRGGATAEVTVTLSEHGPGLTTTTPELFFTGVEGQVEPPPAQTVVLGTTSGADTPFQASFPYWLAVDPWTGTAPGTVAVRPYGYYVYSLGRTDGEIRFQPTWSGSGSDGTTVLVHYDVLPRSIALSSGTVEIVVNGDTTPAQLSVPVTVTSSEPTLGWTVETDNAWLAADPSSGTGSGTVNLSVPLSAVPNLPRGYLQGRALLRYVEPTGGAMSLPIYVYVNNDLPAITSLQPRVGVAGSPAAFAVRLQGTVSTPVIRFGGTPAPSVAPLPDGALQVTPPALPTGRWPVNVQNALGLTVESVYLIVLDPVTRAGASLASAGGKSSLTFDDGTGRLWVANAGAERVERYDEASGWAVATRPVAGLKDAVLTPNGRQVIAVNTDGLMAFAADGLDGAILRYNWSFSAVERPLRWRIVAKADSYLTLVTPDLGGCAGDSWCGILFLSTADWWLMLGYGAPYADGWRPAVPDDLSGAWLLRRGLAVAEPLAHVSGLGWGVTLDGPVLFDGTALDLDRHGDRLLLLDVDPTFAATDGRVAETATGTFLAGALPGSVAAGLLSQDGTWVVAFDGLSRNVRIFDLGAPLDAGRFVEVGTPGGFAPPADPGAQPVLALSIDERTLFLAGDDRVVVCPLP